MTEVKTYSDAEVLMAIGYLSAILADRADAWNGNAPEWFPEPPEWLALWHVAIEATKDESHSQEV